MNRIPQRKFIFLLHYSKTFGWWILCFKALNLFICAVCTFANEKNCSATAIATYVWKTLFKDW